MKTDIWIPIYIGDYMADTIGLTLEEHGAYILLIFAYWKNKGPISEETAQSVMRDASPTHRRRIASFFRVAGGKWHHSRIDHDLKRVSAITESRISAATTAAKARWSKQKSGCVTDASRIPDGCVSYAKSESESEDPQRTTKLPASNGSRFTLRQKNLVARFHKALGDGWENDRQKWMGRIAHDQGKTERILSDLELAIREGDIKTEPAKYAEHRWKEFA